jgi:hypothetical protein
MLRSIASNQIAVRSIGLAFGNLAALGLLIGWNGASRLYGTGLHTLFRDHLPAISVVLIATALLAVFLGRTLSSTREIVQAMWFVVWTDVVAALAITLMIGEMFNHPDLVGAVFAETAGGTQVVAIAIGLAIGYLSRGPYRARS